MDCRKTGAVIKMLRREKQMTQQSLADLVGVTDRAVSKWERGEGCPDITLIKKLATILGVHADSILSGELKKNRADSGKLIRTSFYVCPDCGEIVTATGNAVVSCCGRTISACKIAPHDDDHTISVSTIDDEFYITFNHDMKKDHYIKFIAYVTLNSMHIMRLYPEQSCETRMPIMRGGLFIVCCSKHGLFEYKP